VIGNVIGYAALFVMGQNCCFHEPIRGHTPRPTLEPEVVRSLLDELLDYDDMALCDADERAARVDAMFAGYYGEDVGDVYEIRISSRGDA